VTAWTGYELTSDELGTVGAVVRREAGFVERELPELTLPDAAGPLVLKTYSAARGTPAGLRGMANMRATLPRDLRDRLDRVMSWPVRTVTEHGELRGAVHRRVPAPFQHDLTLPSGRVSRVPREAQFLFVAPARATALGLPELGEQARLRICLALATALELAHEPPLQLVVGGIDARSMLYSTGSGDPDDEPAVLFADCDGVRLRDSSAPPRPVTSPAWDPLTDPDTATRAGDLYKLGLFVLRCLRPGPFGSVLRDPDAAAGALDPVGTALLRRALAPSGADRPSAEEWRSYLSHRLGRAVDPPRITDAALDRTIVAAGEPVTVRWTASEAASVELTAPGLTPIRTGGWPLSGVFEVRPARTGRLLLTARNELGEHTRVVGPVAVVDVPRIGSLPVPVPDVAWPLPQVDAPPLPTLVPPPPLVGSAGGAAGAFWPAPDPPPTAAPPGFGTGALAFPFDLTALFRTGTSDADAPTSPREGGAA
jgi:hypothetical protein